MTEVVQQGGGEAAGTLRPSAKRGNKPGNARGLGRVYEREGGTWWIQYSHRGVLRRKSSGSKVRSKAVKLLKKHLGEIGQGRLVGPDVERTTFEQLSQLLIDNYVVNERKSLDRAQRSVKHLSATFARALAIEITPDRVLAYIRARLEHAKPATVRLELAALKRMFRLGAPLGMVSHRPEFPSIEVRNTRTGFFEDAELRAVLRELHQGLRPLVQFLALTGWRVGEVKGLAWRQLDFDSGMVRLEPGTTKNDEARSFPFAALPALESLLRTQRERTSALERESGQVIPWVFHRNGKPIRSFHSAWRAACKRAEVAGRLIHDLRRTAVRNLERASVPRSWAMKLTGHKTESVYRRYAIVSEADLAEGVRRLAALSPRGESRRVVSISAKARPRSSTEEARFEGTRD